MRYREVHNIAHFPMKIKAFTLVELMVVMAIIAFLSVGAYGGLTFALRQGRDTQRIRIADQIQTALTAYYADYAIYPGCGGWNGSRFNGSGSAAGVAGFVQCAGALDETGPNAFATLTGMDGLKDYFEGEYITGPMANTGTDVSDIRYYYALNPGDRSATRFTVCVTLENPRGGNVSSKSPTARNKGCYCNGADQSLIACSGFQ